MNTYSKPYTIKIIWGASPKSVENDDFKCYSFATIEELIAFVKGCSAAVGYTDFSIIDPSTFINVEDNIESVYPSEREYRIVHNKLILSDRIINHAT